MPLSKRAQRLLIFIELDDGEVVSLETKGNIKELGLDVRPIYGRHEPPGIGPVDSPDVLGENILLDIEIRGGNADGVLHTITTGTRWPI